MKYMLCYVMKTFVHIFLQFIDFTIVNYNVLFSMIAAV